jgi:hypothetical protein
LTSPENNADEHRDTLDVVTKDYTRKTHPFGQL